MTKLQEDTNKQRRNGIIDKNNIKKTSHQKKTKKQAHNKERKLIKDKRPQDIVNNVQKKSEKRKTRSDWAQ